MVFIHDQKVLGVSAKQNLPGDGVYYEPRWFKEWPSGLQTTIDLFGREVPFGDIIYQLKGLKIGFEICEDAWRKDRPACQAEYEGVDLILNPSASHYEFQKVAVREDLIRKSSEQFNCTYLFANQLGNEAGRLIYEGDMIIASKGKILNRADCFHFKTYNLIWSDLQFDGINQEQGPPATIPLNEEFTSVASLALFDYMRKSKSNGFTISLSGGADSSTCAVLVREMIHRAIDQLGVRGFSERISRPELSEFSEAEIVKELLVCVYQGTVNSSTTTRKAAVALATEIGAQYYEWDIDQEVELATRKIENALGRKLDWTNDDLTLQNIQSRMRSPLVWMLANTHKHLLITTSNRSEGDVGYSTMDGDSSGGIAPIADLDKVFVRDWLVWAESTLGYKSLKWVNEQEPTAELRPLVQDQTDEKDLMPYPLLLEIEKLAVWHKHSPLETFEVLKDSQWSDEELRLFIPRFFRSWGISQWKRERMAPSFHFDRFNIDPKSWMRFPILNSMFADEISELTKK